MSYHKVTRPEDGQMVWVLPVDEFADEFRASLDRRYDQFTVAGITSSRWKTWEPVHQRALAIWAARGNR